MSEPYRALRCERTDHVAVVTLSGKKGNPMGPDFWQEMPRLFRELDADDAVRAVIMCGDGDHFTYGLDLPGMMGSLGPLVGGNSLARERTRLLALIGELQGAFNAVARCRVPVIAAVSGWCIGGGLDLIAACDLRICSRDAQFSLREVKVAMVADLGSLQRLPSIIGEGHTRELAFTGKDIDAARALAIGLVNDVYDTKEMMLEAARALASEIAKNPPLVVQGIKSVMNDGAGKSVEEGLRHVAHFNAAFLQSNDLMEALAAFMEKRPPKFTGS